MKNLSPRQALTVFVSSSSEQQANLLREHVKARAQAHSEALRRAGSSLILETHMWEQVPAQQVPNGTVNNLFVKMALASHCTLALLVKELRPGTREEIEAVLSVAPNDVLLSVMYFPPNGNKSESNSDLIAFVEGLEERDCTSFAATRQTSMPLPRSIIFLSTS